MQKNAYFELGLYSVLEELIKQWYSAIRNKTFMDNMMPKQTEGKGF